jgi:hypothetical protein
MKRVAVLSWSISLGVLAFFAGLGVASSAHQLEKWQVGLVAFIASLVIGVPTALATSNIMAAASENIRSVVTLFGCMLFASTQFLFWVTMLGYG